MNKKEIADVLETILDGLTAGESSEKKLEEVRKFYETELAKVNTENRFFERVIRFCLFERYVLIKESLRERFEFEVNGSKLFSRQSQTNNAHYNDESMPGFSLEDFNKFVDEYLTAARNDEVIGIKE